MKKFVIILITMLIVTGITWAQFYTNLSGKDRKELAEAYYLVGKQYQKEGNPSRGKDFVAMAYNIFPGLTPSKIKIHEYPSAEVLLARYNFSLNLPEKQADPTEIIKSKFVRLISNFIAEDSDSILDLLAGTVYISRFSEGITQEETKTALDKLFDKINLMGLPPSSVYNVNSLKITRAPSDISNIWGETYILQIDAIKDFSGYIGFWTKHQVFYFYKPKERWLIYSVGQTPPPITWRPEPVKPMAVKLSTSYVSIDVKESIKRNFINCISSFLKKDLEGTTRYIEDPLKILRLQTVITKKELESTFEGYFDTLDFTGITTDSLIYPDSIFLVRSFKFKNQLALPVYLLTVKTKIDISDKIPFWTRYQEYYFTRDQGIWKIFAIF